MSSSDGLQTILNGMLINYRYGRVEGDFRDNQLTLITPHKTVQKTIGIKNLICSTDITVSNNNDIKRG